MKLKTIFLLLITLLLVSCGGGSSSKNLKHRSAFIATNTSAEVKADTVGPKELQSAVMAFADTANSRLTQAAFILKKRVDTPQARLTSAHMLVYDLSSNIEIAAGPYPGIALLDMVVLSSLRRIIWEDFWIPKVFGKEAEPVLEYYQINEKEIWAIAEKLMTPEQLDELAKVILKWREKNPKQVAVNYVRFDDFGELGLKPFMRKLVVPGGLFASVQEAAIVAQDIKTSIDRAFYLMSRMQLIINHQIELAYLKMLFQPETDGLINTTEKVVGITERYAEIAENLPEEIGGEARETLAFMFDNLAKNRDDTITKALAGLTQWQDETIKGVMSSVSQEREAAINQAIKGVIEQQEAMFKQVDSIVNRGGEEMEESLNHAFMLGVLLIVIFFVLLTLYKVFVARPIDRRNQ